MDMTKRKHHRGDLIIRLTDAIDHIVMNGVEDFSLSWYVNGDKIEQAIGFNLPDKFVFTDNEPVKAYALFGIPIIQDETLAPNIIELRGGEDIVTMMINPDREGQ